MHIEGQARETTGICKTCAVGRESTELEVYCVEKEQIKNQLVIASNNQAFVGVASHVIAGISGLWSKVASGRHLAIALEAVELSLGTCWIGAFNEDGVKKILKIPQDKKVVALLTVGFPAESPASKPRKALEEIVAYNEYT